MGSSSRAPPRNPSIDPPGPPRPSQSSITTSQPTPTIVPKPKVKYSRAPSVRRRLVVRDSKLVFQSREQPLGADLPGGTGLCGALEIMLRTRRILDRAIHRLDRDAGLPRYVGIGPQTQAI